MKNITTLCITFLMISCAFKETDQIKRTPQKVALRTKDGEIVLELSDKTPQHRDNFVKLVKEGAFDSLLFHRVIKGFVIQGGDPDSKYANQGDTLGVGGLNYTVPAEFDSALFHKRGALGAARDGNPERASSAIQFYIVQASAPVTDSLFEVHEKRINGWLRAHFSMNAPENKTWLDALITATKNEDVETVEKIRDTLNAFAQSFTDFETYSIPNEHKSVYRSIGGTPHLDQNYTVFGEVISGMNVVDSIAAKKVDELNRPIAEVRILSARLIE